MPDSKITALTSISTSTDPANDPLVIVDVSDTSMAATGTTKKVTLNQLLATSPTATLASATITGDLTVDTNVLKVDTSLNRVGIGTASPSETLHISKGSAATFLRLQDSSSSNYIGTDTGNFRVLNASVQDLVVATQAGVFTFGDGAGGTRMTLNANGLGVGTSPSYKLQAQTTADGICQFLARSGGTNNPNFRLSFTEATATTTLDANSGAGSPIMALATNGSPRMYIDSSGNVGISVQPSAKLDINGNSAIRLPSAAGSVDLQFPYFGATNAKTIIRATGTADWRQTLKIQMNTAQSDSAPVDVLTFNNAGNLILSLPSVPPALTTNGQLTVNATSDTNLRFSYRGSDGVTRVANITLA